MDRGTKAVNVYRLMKWLSVSTHPLCSLYVARRVGDIINTASWALPGRRALMRRWSGSRWDRGTQPVWGYHAMVDTFALFTAPPHASFIFISQVIGLVSAWERTALFARWHFILESTSKVNLLFSYARRENPTTTKVDQNRSNISSHLQQGSGGVALQTLAQFVHLIQ